MPKEKLETLKALLTEYRNSDYFGLGEMEQIEFIDGLIYQVNEHINEIK